MAAVSVFSSVLLFFKEGSYALIHLLQSCPICEEKQILIFLKKCYDQPFINLADRIAQKERVFF